MGLSSSPLLCYRSSFPHYNSLVYFTIVSPLCQRPLASSVVVSLFCSRPHTPLCHRSSNTCHRPHALSSSFHPLVLRHHTLVLPSTSSRLYHRLLTLTSSSNRLCPPPPPPTARSIVPWLSLTPFICYLSRIIIVSFLCHRPASLLSPLHLSLIHI